MVVYHLTGCELLAARLQIIMDDLLWVLTPTQLKAAWSVVEELRLLASKADEVVRQTVAEQKLNVRLPSIDVYKAVLCRIIAV